MDEQQQSAPSTEQQPGSAGREPTLSDLMVVAMQLVEAIDRLAQSNEAMVDALLGSEDEGGDAPAPARYLDGSPIR